MIKSDSMKEEWMTVQGFGGKYEVSSHGRVKRNGEICSPSTDLYGYKFLTVYEKGKRKYIRIHRLVAIHFVPNPYNLPIVHHIDGNKTNNLASNLFWCTRGQNNSFAVSEKGGRLVTSRRIEQRDYDGTVITTFGSFRIAGEAVGVNDATLIAKCCRGIRKSAYGYRWTFGEGDREYKPI